MVPVVPKRRQRGHIRAAGGGGGGHGGHISAHRARPRPRTARGGHAGGDGRTGRRHEQRSDPPHCDGPGDGARGGCIGDARSGVFHHGAAGHRPRHPGRCPG
eukprot:3616669-Pyramimonas_sp.AAC.1